MGACPGADVLAIAPAAAVMAGIDGGLVSWQRRTLLALPDAILSEVMGEQFFAAAVGCPLLRLQRWTHFGPG